MNDNLKLHGNDSFSKLVKENYTREVESEKNQFKQICDIMQEVIAFNKEKF